MDNQKVAEELVKIAKDITAGNRIQDFIDDNEEAIENEEYAIPKIKLFGPTRDSKHMNVTLKQLKAIAKIVK